GPLACVVTIAIETASVFPPQPLVFYQCLSESRRLDATAKCRLERQRHLVGNVDPDLIEQRNWTDWKPKLDEGPIDLFNRHTLAQDEQRLIQVRRKHPRCVKPRAVTHDDHCLALI